MSSPSIDYRDITALADACAGHSPTGSTTGEMSGRSILVQSNRTPPPHIRIVAKQAELLEPSSGADEGATADGSWLSADSRRTLHDDDGARLALASEHLLAASSDGSADSLDDLATPRLVKNPTEVPIYRRTRKLRERLCFCRQRTLGISQVLRGYKTTADKAELLRSVRSHLAKMNEANLEFIDIRQRLLSLAKGVATDEPFMCCYTETEYRSCIEYAKGIFPTLRLLEKELIQAMDKPEHYRTWDLFFQRSVTKLISGSLVHTQEV